MKIWIQYGSEHSMNLVMIGTFKEERDAILVKQLIEDISKKVAADTATVEDGNDEALRFSEELRAVLQEANFYSVSRGELQQFQYDHSLQLKGNSIILTTDESDVSAFMKLLVERGARVEIFSAHDYPME